MAALVSAAACLTVVASLTVLLLRNARPAPPVLLIMALAFLGSFFYSAPPLRLAASGYGELTTSILVANLVPAFAFLLQTGELHRLVAMSTFPLTLLHLAMMLTFELPDFASDIKHGKRTLMVRLNWQNGMALHNYLILGAYLPLGLAVYGLPMRLPSLLF
jgi:1,4-dihydroxy-2-naphthoate octaprenyltransferase